uniref:Uncharacterized protein n=2 Tax=Timema TaxID=61471 RepID=A0A7R9HUJ4_9NEOP|nr:unnamed protein product [Timema monikensis]
MESNNELNIGNVFVPLLGKTMASLEADDVIPRYNNDKETALTDFELKKLSEESLTRQPEEVFDIICKLGEG